MKVTPENTRRKKKDFCMAGLDAVALFRVITTYFLVWKIQSSKTGD